MEPRSQILNSVESTRAGKKNAWVATNFYTPKSVTFQAVWSAAARRRTHFDVAMLIRNFCCNKRPELRSHR